VRKHQLSGGGKVNVMLLTENPAVARHYKRLIKDYFGTNASLVIAKTTILKKGHYYELMIDAEMNAEQILRETGILMVKEGCNYISDGIYTDLIKTKCCRKAYLKGVFLGAGQSAIRRRAIIMKSCATARRWQLM